MSKTHRVAELEQSERTVKVQSIGEIIGVTGGGLFMGAASFFDFAAEQIWLKWLMFGAGVAATVMGMTGKILVTFFGWPPGPR